MTSALQLDNMVQIELDMLCISNFASDDIKAYWEDKLAKLPKALQYEVPELLAKVPGELNWFTSLQKRKETALAEGDSEAWENIINEEAEHFGQLETKLGEVN